MNSILNLSSPHKARLSKEERTSSSSREQGLRAPGRWRAVRRKRRAGFCLSRLRPPSFPGGQRGSGPSRHRVRTRQLAEEERDILCSTLLPLSVGICGRPWGAPPRPFLAGRGLTFPLPVVLTGGVSQPGPSPGTALVQGRLPCWKPRALPGSEPGTCHNW